MPNFDEATRLAEELFAQEQAKQVEHRTIPKEKKQENLDSRMGGYMVWYIMEIIRNKKIHILIAVYIILIVTELFFYVPYHNIQIFKSKQNVPHTEIIGSGYATMADITSDNAYIEKYETTSSGKTVNTSQIFVNVSITTILATAIYFLLQRKEKKIIEDNVSMPELDIDGLAFADKETQKAEMAKYTQKLTEYIKKKG